MTTDRRSWFKLFCKLFLLWTVLSGTAAVARAVPVEFTDSSGTRIVLSERPQRVVSLVPGITRILFALDAGGVVEGLTWHDTPPPETAPKTIVGGFLAPSVDKIEALKPDVVFLSSLHRDVRERLAGSPCHLIELQSGSIDDIYRHIAILGDIFDRRPNADELIQRIRSPLELVSRKLAKIPASQRKRVLRLMGRDRVMTPGDDSFQNDFIRAAGGLPPELGKKGATVEISLEEWRHFNPQVVYGCGDAGEVAEALLTRPGWKDVEAVREGRILTFPCELTCQASMHTGDFVAWLASALYEEAFSRPSNQVLEEKRTGSRPVGLPLEYVKSARVVESNLYDFPNKTLLIEFKRPMHVLSTLEGERSGITTVGNHGSPPPCWSIGHRVGIETSWNRICKVMGTTRPQSSFLMTGANLDNLAVRKAHFKDMTVTALVTAGVEGNAIRSAFDEGRFYEPGTINIILMADRSLSPRARARAVICATEAKSAALQDLDIRSGGDRLRWQATGTGTDEILVVEGSGARLENAGGHCKLGELIARAVYDGVREAVLRQNSIAVPRNVLRRLQEREITPSGLLRRFPDLERANGGDVRRALQTLEEILLEPRYAAFVEASLALSDAHERGQLTDLNAHAAWCKNTAAGIAGDPVEEWKEMEPREDIPPVLRMSLEAVMNGLVRRPGGADETRTDS